MKYWLKNSFAALILATAVISTAQAQATRTWVSGVGDDANPCSRTAPCKTFAGAISKTAAGGEISALDPGGFGVVTITKSITINGDGTLAGILAALTNGIIVNAANTDVVRLRNISINGAKTGLNGIRFLAGNTLELDNVSIYGFTTHGIDVSLSTNDNRNLLVKNSSITNALSNGVNISSTVGGLTGKFSAVLDHVSIHKTGKGIYSNYTNAVTTIGNSVITQASVTGVHAQAGKIGLEGSSLTNNNVAIQADANGKVWITDNDMFNNTTLFVGCGATTLLTNQDNRTGGNGGIGCTPTGLVDLK